MASISCSGRNCANKCALKVRCLKVAEQRFLHLRSFSFHLDGICFGETRKWKDKLLHKDYSWLKSFWEIVLILAPSFLRGKKRALILSTIVDICVPNGALLTATNFRQHQNPFCSRISSNCVKGKLEVRAFFPPFFF